MRWSFMAAAGLALSACNYAFDNPVEDGYQGVIRGQVVTRAATTPGALTANAADLVPLAGAVCTLEGTSKSAESDAQGNFTLRGVADGSYILICKYTLGGGGVLVVLRVVEVAGGEPVSLGQLELVFAGSIAGQATLAGRPDHTGIAVFVPGLSFSAFTEASGAFLIGEVPPGSYSLRYEKDGFSPVQIDDILVNAELTTDAGDVTLALSTGPSGTILIEGGALVSTSPTVSVRVLATAEASLMLLSEQLSFIHAEWRPTAPEVPWTFAGDGAHTLYAKFSNTNGLESPPVSDAITVDTTPPVPGSIVINGHGGSACDNTACEPGQVCSAGACVPAALAGAYTRSPAVNLEFTAYDEASWLVDMMISADPAFADVTWEPYAAARAFALPAGDGEKTVYAVFRDAAGFASAAAATGTIILDTAGPAAPTALVVDSDDATGSIFGDGYARTPFVWVQGSTAEYAPELLLSEDADFATAQLRLNFDTSAFHVPFTLSQGDGAKTVYVKVRDVAGNESEPAMATLVLDTTPPTAPGVSAPAIITAPNTTVTITVDVPSVDANLAGYRVCDGPCTDFAVGEPLWATLPPGATRQFVVLAFDWAGNESQWVTLPVTSVTALMLTVSLGGSIYPSGQYVFYAANRPITSVLFEGIGDPVSETPVSTGGGNYVHLFSGLAAGTYSLTITARDEYASQTVVMPFVYPHTLRFGCVGTTASTASLVWCPAAGRPLSGSTTIATRLSPEAGAWKSDIIDALPPPNAEGCYETTIADLNYAPAHTYFFQIDAQVEGGGVESAGVSCATTL